MNLSKVYLLLGEVQTYQTHKKEMLFEKIFEYQKQPNPIINSHLLYKLYSLVDQVDQRISHKKYSVKNSYKSHPQEKFLTCSKDRFCTLSVTPDGCKMRIDSIYATTRLL